MADDAPAATVTENGTTPAEHTVDDAPGFKVFAGNLAYSVTDEGLRAFFMPVQSDILSAQVIMRGTRAGMRSAGYGFVALSSEEAAHKAVELLDKKELDGRQVIVEVAKPADQKDKEKIERKAKRRPGRRGSKAVPGEVSEAEANGHAEKPEEGEAGAEGAEGDQQKPKKTKKKARKSKRKPAAKDADGEGATTEPVPAGTEVPAVNGDAHDDHEGEAPAPKKRTPKPRRPRPARPAGEDPVGEPSKTMLFVANLNFSVDDAGLAKVFSDAGITVQSARVVRRRFGNPRKSKGYGFVDVGSEEEQKKAIEALAGKELEGGRQIAVKVAVNTADKDEEEPVANAEEVPQPAEAPAS